MPPSRDTLAVNSNVSPLIEIVVESTLTFNACGVEVSKLNPAPAKFVFICVPVMLLFLMFKLLLPSYSNNVVL